MCIVEAENKIESESEREGATKSIRLFVFSRLIYSFTECVFHFGSVNAEHFVQWRKSAISIVLRLTHTKLTVIDFVIALFVVVVSACTHLSLGDFTLIYSYCTERKLKNNTPIHWWILTKHEFNFECNKTVDSFEICECHLFIHLFWK